MSVLCSSPLHLHFYLHAKIYLWNVDILRLHSISDIITLYIYRKTLCYATSQQLTYFLVFMWYFYPNTLGEILCASSSHEIVSFSEQDVIYAGFSENFLHMQHRDRTKQPMMYLSPLLPVGFVFSYCSLKTWYHNKESILSDVQLASGSPCSILLSSPSHSLQCL